MKDVWGMLTRAALQRIREIEGERDRIDPHSVAREVLGRHAISDDALRLRLEHFVRDMSGPPRPR